MVDGLGYALPGDVPRHVLQDVGFTVSAGGVFTVMGPSGSGKSTLLRALNRLLEPTFGRVLLDGVPTDEMPVPELRRRVGLVFQHPALFEGTVLDNVLYGPRLRRPSGRLASGEERDQAVALLDRVGLAADFACKPADELSGGEAQRVCLARALANDPQVLLLDEPTTALDPAARRQIEDLLACLTAESALTSVFVTHDLAQARRIGDHGLLLVDGRAVEQGPLPAMLDHPREPATRLFAEGRLPAGGRDGSGPQPWGSALVGGPP